MTRINFKYYLTPALLLPFTLSLFMTGCTRQKTETPPADLAVNSVTLGKAAFAFDPAQTTSLSVAKADPISGETWSARVEKTDANGLWQIASYSGESQLSDRLANKAWILHFFETLTTFRPDSFFADSDSGHFGFSPPRYSVDWRIQGVDGKTATYELRVGSPVDFEKSPDGEAFTIFPPHAEIYQAGGAALVMLRYLKGFSSLRLETLSTVEAADVTEIEMTGRKTLHSQFNGKKWIGAEVSVIVPFLTHLRIEKFLDGVRPKVSFIPVLTVRLTDRYSHVTVLSFDSQDLAENSDRAGALFQMYPGITSKLASGGP
jgi:hypothetical protein